MVPKMSGEGVKREKIITYELMSEIPFNHNPFNQLTKWDDITAYLLISLNSNKENIY
jgi:hypothetical protein